MGDVDVLDMLFDGDHGILNLTTASGDQQQQQKHQRLVVPSAASATTTDTAAMIDGPGNILGNQNFNPKMLETNFDGLESDWSSSLLSPSLVCFIKFIIIIN